MWNLLRLKINNLLSEPSKCSLLPEKVVGFFLLLSMEYTNIQKNLILLSLNNLVEEYSNALEENQITPEGRGFMITAIHEMSNIINTISQELKEGVEVSHKIQRPKWTSKKD